MLIISVCYVIYVNVRNVIMIISDDNDGGGG